MTPLSLRPSLYLDNVLVVFKRTYGHHSRSGKEIGDEPQYLGLGLDGVVEARRVNECDRLPVQQEGRSHLDFGCARFQAISDSQLGLANEINELYSRSSAPTQVTSSRSNVGSPWIFPLPSHPLR